MKKKQLIMGKALELFARQGFEATSVQQITEYCGISKGAFYLSFKSKDELILAIIDDFMKQITAEVDRVVRYSSEKELLFSFYKTMFRLFERYSDFGKLLFKEQTHPLNEGFLLKLREYNQLIDKSILLMLERIYGEEIQDTKFDIAFCIKALLNSYAGLFLFHAISPDFEALCASLEEKTQILAKYSTKSVISKGIMAILESPYPQKVSKEDITNLIESVISDMDDSLAKESLILLKEQLNISNPPRAIIIGLLENIKTHQQCSWIGYLLREYYGLCVN